MISADAAPSTQRYERNTDVEVFLSQHEYRKTLLGLDESYQKSPILIDVVINMQRSIPRSGDNALVLIIIQNLQSDARVTTI